jgi:hypothetical protein
MLTLFSAQRSSTKAKQQNDILEQHFTPFYALVACP